MNHAMSGRRSEDEPLTAGILVAIKIVAQQVVSDWVLMKLSGQPHASDGEQLLAKQLGGFPSAGEMMLLEEEIRALDLMIQRTS